jgi:hypothetical protein
MRLQAHTALGRKATHLRGFFIVLTCLGSRKTSWSTKARTDHHSLEDSKRLHLGAAFFHLVTIFVVELLQ